MHAVLTRLLCGVVFTASCLSADAHAQNANIQQIPESVGNMVTLSQSGAGHRANVEQEAITFGLGTGANNANIVQSNGDHNSASVAQHGQQNSVEVGQYGSNLRTEVTQNGSSLGVTISEYGIGNGQPITVTQTGPSGAPATGGKP